MLINLRLWAAFASSLLVAVAASSQHPLLLQSGDALAFDAPEQSLAHLPSTEFTTLRHAAHPQHSVRIRRVHDFCDPDVKCALKAFGYAAATEHGAGAGRSRDTSTSRRAICSSTSSRAAMTQLPTM